jgi:hypothetical protein
MATQGGVKIASQVRKGGVVVAIMETYRTYFTGQFVAKCPECARVLAYWDEDDLNDAGELECWCWEL